MSLTEQTVCMFKVGDGSFSVIRKNILYIFWTLHSDLRLALENVMICSVRGRKAGQFWDCVCCNIDVVYNNNNDNDYNGKAHIHHCYHLLRGHHLSILVKFQPERIR